MALLLHIINGVHTLT